MEDDHTRWDRVFIVRLWEEPKQAGSAGNSWRGRVTDLGGRTETHFVGFGALMEILRQAVGIETDEKPKSQAKVMEKP